MKKHVIAMILAMCLMTGCAGKPSNPDIPRNGLGLALTDAWATGVEKVIASEHGWYFTAAPNGNYSSIYGNNYVLCYADGDTGQVVPLCPKPNCTHDGSIYCTASTHAYDYDGYVYHDGFLYALAYKNSNPENRVDMSENTATATLIRIAADGTEITELTNFGGDRLAPARYLAQPLIHRGYVWCLVEKCFWQAGNGDQQDMIGGYDVADRDIGHYGNGGFEIVGYELATGKTITVFSTYPEIGETLSDQKTLAHYYAPHQLYPTEEGLGFLIEAEDVMGIGNTNSPALKGKGFYTLDLETGTASLVTDQAKYDGQIEVSEGNLFYPWHAKNDYTHGITIRYDLSDGTKTELDLDMQNAIAGDGHLVTWHLDAEQVVMEVYDYDGNLLQTFPFEKGKRIYPTGIADGWLYFYSNGGWKDTYEMLTDAAIHANEEISRCPMAEVLNGTLNRTVMYSPYEAYLALPFSGKTGR